MAKPEANEDLSAYLDGELTDAEIAELEAELARDPELRAELESLESVVHWVREEGPDAAPLGFHHRVMARIEQEHPERPSLWAWLRRPLGLPLEGWLVALAAAAALLVLIPGRDEPSGTEGWVEPPPDAGSPAAVKMPVPTEPAPSPAVEVEPAPAPAVQEKAAPRKPVEKDPAPPEPAPTTAAEPDVSGTPDEPPTKSPLVGAGYSYVVRSASPAMKLDLLRLAGRYGGAMDAGGAEITDSTMSFNTEALLVNVAQPDLTRFARELEALGYELVKEPSSEIVAGTTIPVRITLQLVGGSTEGTGAAPNAARKEHEFEADALEEAQ